LFTELNASIFSSFFANHLTYLYIYIYIYTYKSDRFQADIFKEIQKSAISLALQKYNKLI